MITSIVGHQTRLREFMASGSVMAVEVRNMRNLLYVFLIFLVACQGGETSLTVKQLENKVTQCAQTRSKSCLAFRRQLATVEALVYRLQESPQAFGLSVLQLQEIIGKNESSLHEALKNAPDKGRIIKLKRTIKAQEQLYQAQLSVLRLLEAPGS